eukprot:TRINITY_DN38222_c0_g1_i1.p1 TRINITY_DN38222_c0_g1~~TRINITY_DN38222_c0_g1_i1.p1  ORF type:complete len:213 (+),score=32.33 TRINITY_DN38222_c0_g1_i1:39-641(+)
MYHHPSMEGEVCFDDDYSFNFSTHDPLVVPKADVMRHAGGTFEERRRALMGKRPPRPRELKEEKTTPDAPLSVRRTLIVDDTEDAEDPTSTPASYKDLYVREHLKNKEIREQQVMLLGFLDQYINTHSEKGEKAASSVSVSPPLASPIPSSSPSFSDRSSSATPMSVGRAQPMSVQKNVPQPRRSFNTGGGPVVRCPRLR